MRALLAAVLLLAAAPARAQRVVAVLSSDLPAYREAFSAFEALAGTTTVLPVVRRADLGPETEIVVAFGGKAARKKYPEHVTVVQVLAPGVEFLPAFGGKRVIRVRSMLKPGSVVARAKELAPGLESLAVIWSLPESEPYMLQMEKEGRALGVRIVCSRVRDPDELPAALRALPDRVGAIWLPPDPAIVDAGTFRITRSYARARGIPLFAPLAALVAEGADAAIAPSAAELGRAAAGVVRRMLAGQPLEDEVYAK